MKLLLLEEIPDDELTAEEELPLPGAEDYGDYEGDEEEIYFEEDVLDD